MLQSLEVRAFKSLRRVGPVELAPLTVFFGPNASGKSNLLDAIVLLSRLATERTVAEALEGPIRGNPLELFSFPRGAGLPGLVESGDATFRLEAVVRKESERMRYAIELGIVPESGRVTVRDEFLANISSRKGALIGNPRIERHGSTLRIRRQGKQSHPFEETLPLNHAILSNRQYGGERFATIEAARDLVASFRSYYLDPRTAMRRDQPPREVVDIGTEGELVAPFLYRLRSEHPKKFASIRRTLSTLIPSIDDLRVNLDRQKGLVDLEILQDGTPFSARIISEGTLRILALLCVTANPWGGPVIAFEEPENGVHPRRIELVAEILGALALRDRDSPQVVLTTHSPLFCRAVLGLARRNPGRVRLYRTFRQRGDTRIEPFDTDGPLFDDAEVREALRSAEDDAIFEGLLLRGLLDG